MHIRTRDPRSTTWEEDRWIAIEAPRRRVINCECGSVVRAGSDDELVEKVEQHVSEAHPELVGKMSREDILAMAEAA